MTNGSSRSSSRWPAAPRDRDRGAGPNGDGAGKGVRRAPGAEAADVAGHAGGYEPGQRVRWKRLGGSRWRYGHLADDPVEADGSVRVYDDISGAARTLRPGQLQLLARGPRGGQRWLPYGAPAEPAPGRAPDPPVPEVGGLGL